MAMSIRKNTLVFSFEKETRRVQPSALEIDDSLTEAQTMKAAPSSSVQVQCDGDNTSGGSGWNLLGTLSNLLLGDSDEDYEDDDNGDDSDGDEVSSSSEQRAGSEEDDYYWLDLGMLDDSSSEEAARREPTLPGEMVNSSLPGEVANSPLPGELANSSLPSEVANNSLPGELANTSLPGEVANSLSGEFANNSLSRNRRAAPSWSLGDIDVHAGKNWSVRVFNWVLVRRDPATDRVEVKLLMPNVFSPAASDDDDDVADSSSERGARTAPQPAGDIEVQGGKNWSVRVFNWVLVRRNPTTGQVEVKLQVPGLFSLAGGADDDDIDNVDVSDGGRETRSTRFEAGAATFQEDGLRRVFSSEDSSHKFQLTAS